MSLNTWKWLSSALMLLLFAGATGYTYYVFRVDAKELWAWGHQIVAVFFSVAFAFAAAVWLYAWQMDKASSGKKDELRAAQIISVFDTWDRLDDKHLQTVELPDGTEAKILLTFLQPIVYEESIRSGLFGADEAFTMSRLSTVMHLYNTSVQNLTPLVKDIGSADAETVSEKRLNHLRSEFDNVLEHREKVVQAGRNLIELWSLKEVRKAIALADPGASDNRDQRVTKVIEGFLPKVSPPSYKAVIYDKMDKAKDAFQDGDLEAASDRLDEATEEVNKLRDSKITDTSADELLSAIASAREALKSNL